MSRDGRDGDWVSRVQRSAANHNGRETLGGQFGSDPYYYYCCYYYYYYCYCYCYNEVFFEVEEL